MSRRLRSIILFVWDPDNRSIIYSQRCPLVEPFLGQHIITVEHICVRIAVDLCVMMAPEKVRIEHGCHSWAGFNISYCSRNRPGVSSGIPLSWISIDLDISEGQCLAPSHARDVTEEDTHANPR